MAERRSKPLANVDPLALAELQAASIERVVARVRDQLDLLTPQEQFDAVHAVVSRIVVYRDSRIEIDACIPLGGGDAERATLVIASMPSWTFPSPRPRFTARLGPAKSSRRL